MGKIAHYAPRSSSWATSDGMRRTVLGTMGRRAARLASAQYQDRPSLDDEVSGMAMTPGGHSETEGSRVPEAHRGLARLGLRLIAGSVLASATLPWLADWNR